jgi:hypothetical protein
LCVLKHKKSFYFAKTLSYYNESVAVVNAASVARIGFSFYCTEKLTEPTYICMYVGSE